MTKIIEVIIATNGETKVETKRFAGAECQEASRFLETALGQKTSERLTAEFHQAQQTPQTNQQQT